jgi:hypothetical protein
MGAAIQTVGLVIVWRTLSPEAFTLAELDSTGARSEAVPGASDHGSV